MPTTNDKLNFGHSYSSITSDEMVRVGVCPGDYGLLDGCTTSLDARCCPWVAVPT